MKLCIIAVIAFIGCATSLKVDLITGTTAPPCAISNSFCSGKENGNYEHPTLKNYFISCSENIATCTPCWPLSLFFKQECNQCLYSYDDDCYTTESWAPHTTFACPPGVCEGRSDKTLNKNIEDPKNPYHYIGCWEGMTRGCVVCPAGLKFNEPCNACLHKGLYVNEDDIKRSVVIQLVDSSHCLSAQSEYVAEFVECDFGPTNDNNKRQKFFFDEKYGKIQNVYYHKCLQKSDSSDDYVLGDCGTKENPVSGLEFKLDDYGILKDSAHNCVGGGYTYYDVPSVDANCDARYEVQAGESYYK